MLLGLQMVGADAYGRERTRLFRIAALLRTVEELPDGGATGVLSFDRSGGTILVEQGRVCWAVVPSSRMRLADRLRHLAGVAPASWEPLLRECMASGRPLVQALVERHVLDASDLRLALLGHLAEAMELLALEDEVPRWTPFSERRYEAQVTFSPVELLVHAADAEAGPLADLARADLRSLLQRGGAGCALLPCGSGMVPIGVLNAELLGVSGVIELTEWTTAIVHTAEEAAGSCKFAAALHESGRSAVAWIGNGIHYGAICDRSEMGCILARLHHAPEDEVC